ncbi:MAG: hypothetical protein ACE5FF_17135 [Saprospiraceae bacterium]
MKLPRIIFASAALLLFHNLSTGQTCCSGGVPLSSNLGLPPEEGKTLQLNLNYDLNVLQTLKTGSETLDDDSRTRRTHSVLLQGGYSLSERFSVDALISWVRQERNIRQFGNTDFTATDGVGDAVFLFKYKLLATAGNLTTVTGALGVKAPLGASGLKRSDGLTINADLQPGSGAWDGILWGQVVHVLKFRPGMSVSGTVVYGLKGKNRGYLGSQVYQFGNELQVSGSLAGRLLMGSFIIDPSLTLRFRNVSPDRVEGLDVPSTGGNWLFLSPGLNYWFNPKYAFNARVELPLIASITGTQVSPTYRINVGFFAKINFQKQSAFQPEFKVN